MKISIIIPVYNAEKYLEQCIESALHQSYADIEIIAVNDGSTDQSVSILNKYKNDIIVIDKKNGGTASALNLGIKNMTGDWFKWLSADDVLVKNTIEKLVVEIDKLGKEAERCILYSNYDIIDKNGNILETFVEPNYNSLDIFQRNVILLDHFYGNGTTSIMHKSIFDNCGLFNETLEYKDDYEFWLRCCLLFEYKLHLVNENLAKYRIHESQLTKKRYNDALEKITQIRLMILKQLHNDLQSKYLIALKNYEKQKPLKTKIQKNIRNLIFDILPQNTSNRILEFYLNKKSN